MQLVGLPWDISNKICLQFGFLHYTTSGGSTAKGTVRLPISYTAKYSVATSTARTSNIWDYSDSYSCTICTNAVSSFEYRCIAPNNGQYIDGFFWIAMGY